ncbi:MAG: TonB-dependent receptor [Aliidongia sp.]
MRARRTSPGLVSALALLIGLSGQAFADQAATGSSVAASHATPGDVEEIVVTAQKRAETLKDIPISISAFNGSAIEDKHIADYDDIARAVPGLSFNALAASEGLDNITIRGVSSTSGSATVGVYLDDVSITVKNFFDGSSQPQLFDIDRIEVLRGPQGTLYGASSEGGTIRFVTKQPDLDNFSAEISTDLGGHRAWRAELQGAGRRQRADRRRPVRDPRQHQLHRQ